MTGANGRLKLGLFGKWHDCDLSVIGYGSTYYVTFHTSSGFIRLGGRREHISHALRAAADLIDGIPPKSLVTNSAAGPGPDVTNLVTGRTVLEEMAASNPTPSQVLEHFRNSSELAPMADDVAAALKGHISQDDQGRHDAVVVLSVFDRGELIDDQGQAKYGAQAKVAKALDIPNAGSYRDRILTVLRHIARKKTTTTGQTSQINQKSA